MIQFNALSLERLNESDVFYVSAFDRQTLYSR